MPFYSSTIPSNLVVSGVTYIRGATGPTGPIGITGFSITGPTGASGASYVISSIENYVFGITYTNNTFVSFGVTAPSGSILRVANPNLKIQETGNSTHFSLFAGFSGNNPYHLLFKSLKVEGEATAGISFDSFYIESPSAPSSIFGRTGGLLYLDSGTGPGDLSAVPTRDSTTRYNRDITSPVSGSLLGLTLDNFTFKINQDYTTQFKVGYTGNLNWINVENDKVNEVLNQVDVSYALTSNSSGIFNRTDQGIFITVKDEDGNLYPKMSFRVEGITFIDTPEFIGVALTGPIQIDMIGKGITYSNQTYSSSIIGSCCYCTNDPEGTGSIVSRTCIDYVNKAFCENIKGNFSFKSCNERYLTGDCYSGGVCCVNGICIETNKEVCNKVFGTFFQNIRCSELNIKGGCPDTCTVSDNDASCCVSGTCYSLPLSDASQDICRGLNGIYAEVPCEERNCCIDGIYGACCFGKTECIDNLTPKECMEQGGIYQGPTSVCANSSCCTDTLENRIASTRVLTDANIEITNSLQIGDYFEGGIVAGFVGYPPPSGFDTSGYFARGEVISEIENAKGTGIKNYIAVNGVFNSRLNCNCSNFSPSRYVTSKNLGDSSGKILIKDIKSLSGYPDKYKLTFYNRLSDVCFTEDSKSCNDGGGTNKKYGFNSILAYKQFAKHIHGENIPNAWVLVVAPEDFGDTLSFGMSMSVSGFSVPSYMKNYTDSLWQNNVLTPYGTTVFDGLLNTRLFDETTIERNTWFIRNNYIIDGTPKTIDPLAMLRFKHSKANYWQSAIDENLITTNETYFKEKYKEMWYAVNNQTTALYQISSKNKQMYNGYSDWYIPSALELNMMYHNLDAINQGIIYNSNSSSWKTISNQNKYWSSTTGGKVIEIKSAESGSFGVKNYENYNFSLEDPLSSPDGLLDTWKKYKTTQAHRAYTQDFSTGKMVSLLKSSQQAKLRACRMIPIYFKTKNYENQFEYSFKTMNTCSSCR
jgi:hypothetical protein